MAIAVWSLLLALLSLVTPEGPLLAAACVLLVVSISSSFALLLFGQDSSDNNRLLSSIRERIPFAISFGIPIGWAMRLGIGTESFVWALYLVVAIVPTAVMLLLFKPRPSHNLTTVRNATSNEKSRIEPTSSEPSATDSADLDELIPEIGLYQTNSNQFDESSFDLESPVSSDVTQWLTRTLTAEGEMIEGGVRIDFAEGQRDATVHVSFCPPFRGIPEVTTEDLDGMDLEIRVSASFPFGTRLTIRRNGHSALGGKKLSAKTCRIGFAARAILIRRAA